MANTRFKKEVEKIEKQMNTVCEYLWAFDFMPPRGDGAKAEAIREFKAEVNKVVQLIKDLERKQIELLEKE